MSDRQPCGGCGYMIRGGSYCGDCNEYGPPRDWRWLYDAETGKHLRVEVTACTLDTAEVCGDPVYCREHGCQL
jgi:hypothetical protein